MKKLFCILMALVLSVSLLGGCKAGSGSASGTTPSPKAPTADEQAKANELVSAIQEMADNDAKPSELLTLMEPTFKYLNKDQATSVIENLVNTQEYFESQYNEDLFIGNTQELLIKYFNNEFDPQKVDTILEADLKKKVKEILAGGYKFVMVEGSYMSILDYEQLKKYEPSITEELKAYIDIMAAQSNQPAAMDGGLLISWDELAKRAVNVESYIEKYPDSPRKPIIEDMYKGYTLVYLSGIDSTPAFDSVTGEIDTELLKSYKSTVAQYTGSGFAKTVGDYMALLEKEQYKNTENVQAFVAKLNEE